MRVVESSVSRPTAFASVLDFVSRTTGRLKARASSARAPGLAGPKKQPRRPPAQARPRSAEKTTVNALGIDIGASEIRIVQSADVRLADGSVECRIDKAICIPMPPRGLLSGGEQVVGDIIRKALTREGIAQKRCVMGVGGPEATLDVLQFTRMRAKERRSAARGDIKRLRVQELGADPVVMLGPKVGDALRSDDLDDAGDLYLVGAVKRTAVDFRRSVAKAAGLVLLSCEHSAFALRRVCVTDGVPPDAIVDVGSRNLNVYAFNNDAAYSQSDRSDDWVDKSARLVSKLRGDGMAKARNISLVGTRADYQASAPRFEAVIEAAVSYVVVDDPSGTEDVLYSPSWILAYGYATYTSEVVARDDGQPTASALLADAATANAATPHMDVPMAAVLADPMAESLAGAPLPNAVRIGDEPLDPSPRGGYEAAAISEDEHADDLSHLGLEVVDLEPRVEVVAEEAPSPLLDSDDAPPSIDYAAYAARAEVSA